jgi:hypothetical protein
MVIPIAVGDLVAINAVWMLVAVPDKYSSPNIQDLSSHLYSKLYLDKGY